MQVLVPKNTTVDITVYAWEVGDKIEATHDSAQVPEKAEKVEKIRFTFRRPTHADSVAILRSAAIRNDKDIDISAFQDVILRTLLCDWNVTDGAMMVAFKSNLIGQLDPTIARAAVAGCLEKVNII